MGTELRTQWHDSMKLEDLNEFDFLSAQTRLTNSYEYLSSSRDSWELDNKKDMAKQKRFLG